jgi:hypothetical protein
VSATLALSVTGLSVRAAAIAALAIAALLLAGWRKPARAEPGSPRGSSRGSSRGAVRREGGGVGPAAFAVDHLDTPTERRPGLVRRVLALAASSAIGVLMGVLSAILLAFAAAYAVIWLTNLLQK